jgi:hypothetical protein
MTPALTKKDLHEAFSKLPTKTDLARMEVSLKKDIDLLSSQIHESFSDLQTSVDTYLKRTEDWHQEFAVLNARHKRLTEVLTKKGFVSEDELSLA